MNVLIVDDQAMNRLVLKRLLSRFSALTVYEAEDGEVAWEKLPMFDPALIFCDIFMPKVDGLSFVMRLREHPLYSALPVIITSAGKDRDVLLKLKELGITDYLLKPYELKSTFERIASHIQPMLDERRNGPIAVLGSTGAIPAPPPEDPPAEAPTAENSEAPEIVPDASSEPAESKG